MSSNNPPNRGGSSAGRGGRATRPAINIPQPPAPPRAADSLTSPNDFWSQLPTDKRQVMQTVFIQYRNRQIDYRQFLATSRDVLGEELYGELYQRLSQAVPQRPTSQPTTPPIGASMSMPSIGTGSMAQPVESANAEEGDVDVMKIDAANLQDVMQYTGFDLRTEAESMSSHFLQHQPSGESRPREEDLRSMPQYYFNATRMRSILSVFCRQWSVQEVDERVMEMLGLALQTRLRNILHLLVTISRHRVDYGRRLYKIKIENDPKKQYWLLERLRTNPPWHRASGSEPTDASTLDPNQLRAEQHPLLSKESHLGQAKKKPVPSGGPVKKDDQSNAKSKMTNVTAMAAAGMKQRSWMTGTAAPIPMGDDSAGTSDPAGTDPSNPHPSTPEPNSEPISLANAPSSIPLTDADLAAQLRTRTINRHDFLSACDHDHKLRRSKLHIQLLDLAPLVAAAASSSTPAAPN